jgi:hypothetical protein
MVTMLGLLIAALLLVAGPAPAAAGEPILVPAVSTPWPGKIFVSHDEWTLSDSGFRVAPDADRFARNLAAWFTGGRPGHFLVYSTSPGLRGKSLERTIKSAGHGWTLADMKSPLTLQKLQKYDAVFLAERRVDAEVLIDYVRSGGHVYLAGGTGGNEAAAWNRFLEPFGLRFDRRDDRIYGAFNIDSSSPLFAGVDALMAIYGTPVELTDPSSTDARILVAANGRGVYAVYDSGAVAVSVTICPEQFQILASGSLSISIAGSGTFDVRAIDPESLRVGGTKAKDRKVGYLISPVTGPLIGRLGVGDCAAQLPDTFLDMTMKVENRDLAQALEYAVARPLRDGETIAVTVSGRLKREFGEIPFVGEDLIVVVRKPR